MSLYRFFEYLLIAIIFVIVITQVLMPLIRGTKLFPSLRRQAMLERELADARQEGEDAKLEKQIKQQSERNSKTK